MMVRLSGESQVKVKIKGTYISGLVLIKVTKRKSFDHHRCSVGFIYHRTKRFIKNFLFLNRIINFQFSPCYEMIMRVQDNDSEQ